MKNCKNIMFYCLLIVCSLTLLGCGKKADEKKPISEVKAEADKMDVEQLRSMALKYKDAIAAKEKEIMKISAKLKDIPPAEMLGKEAKALKADIDNLSKSVSALEERFKIYYNKIKEKGGDLSDLKI